MDDIKEEKQLISNDIIKKIESFSKDEVLRKSTAIENRLFEFANFIEAYVVLFYLSHPGEVDTRRAIEKGWAMNKIVVLPARQETAKTPLLLKVDDLVSDVQPDARGDLRADPSRCRRVPINSIELAMIPGLVFDEKGARIGLGSGLYDKLIPKLPATTRKVALAFEDQIIQQVPKGSIDRYVDIIITEKRVIYKI